MKKVYKSNEPQALASYKQQNPDNKWEQFTSGTNRKKRVQKKLMDDQGGLCTYCETDLRREEIADTSDFRVEHFHPKSDDSSDHNWGLDWGNLLACCHGGSSRNVSDSRRFTEDKTERSCDVPKDDENWDHVILNPLRIPADTVLFKFSRTDGKMQAIDQNCTKTGVSPTRAKDTVDKLQLNVVRLCKLRKAVLNKLNDDLFNMLQSGQQLQDARKKLAQLLLRKDNQGRWPAFFSSIRYYLGNEAEDHLREIGYAG